MNIHLYIDQLVLEGLPVSGGQADLIKSAVEAELKQLLTDGMLAPNLRTKGSLASIQSKELHIAAEETPTSLGLQIGQILYGSIRK